MYTYYLQCLQCDCLVCDVTAKCTYDFGDLARFLHGLDRGRGVDFDVIVAGASSVHKKGSKGTN